MCVHICSTPHGKMADMPKSTLDSHRIDIWFYYYVQYVRASHACKLPIALMGDLRLLVVCRAAVSLSRAAQ